jgi:hypothetical protein
MSELAKVKEKFAKELLQHFDLEEDSGAVARPDDTPLTCIQAFVAAGCFNDAVKMIAHALPKREAVWWACLAARHSLSEQGEPETGANHQAVIAAENWVKSPTEENRQLARQWGDKTQYKSAASWAATSAYWSTGSMTPAGEPAVPPPQYLYAHAVAGSVALAAVQPDPEASEEKFQRYIKQGLDLANGGRGELN